VNYTGVYNYSILDKLLVLVGTTSLPPAFTTEFRRQMNILDCSVYQLTATARVVVL